MDQVRVYTPENRLAKILDGIGGRTIDDMAADAESRVERLSDAIRGFAAEQVAEIIAIHQQGEIAMFAQAHDVAQLAMNIAETAGAARMHGLGEVARGVCAMIDALVTDGVWHTDALEAHIASLTLLSGAQPLGEAETARIVARLCELRAAVGVCDD